MNRTEYMEKMRGTSDRFGLHHEYYLNLAQAGGMHLPDNLWRLVRKSSDLNYFNDVPLGLWDSASEGQKALVASANKIVNGSSVYSLCDGVCALKALARQRMGIRGANV